MSFSHTAMIFAAGRGERMRPLSDAHPKPLLTVLGKPLIVWQIERLARAGFTTIVINHHWLGEQIEATLGSGAQWGIQIHYCAEDTMLETAGAIRCALPLLEAQQTPCTFVAVSADIFTDYDYHALRPHLQRLQGLPEPHMHLVMVPNPEYYPDGDFALENGLLSFNRVARLTFGNIGVYDTRMFYDLNPGKRCALTPYYLAAIKAQRASGEVYQGNWANVGTPEQLRALNAQLHQNTPAAHSASTR
ncbi:nucleotidyltransferase family protein [Mycoavidus sp. HKI]|uniref:N-acetylmuramate alpha-1-phosphate uridylyltransferase MurU n=1 Tax=Mycoavidus sp. HKI TaxID=2840467 RepID=UPI001CC1C023|nr:nucleotidyltransferase family protein [Mycoavidus sp. HKI]UAW64504.1 nucleotidyltransferase family protein [Mycoavidus sp. HKI]